MLTIAILFSPLSTASNLTSQLHNFFSAQLAGLSDEVRVSIRTAPNLLPPCEQPLLSMSNNSRLWGNVNVLARCGNDKRYLQVNVQATGNYVVAAMPIVRGGKLEAGNVKLKRGWIPCHRVRCWISINLLMPLACAIYHPINLSS
jgi:flagella basal body P-ring formation protein FlgA